MKFLKRFLRLEGKGTNVNVPGLGYEKDVEGVDNPLLISTKVIKSNVNGRNNTVNLRWTDGDHLVKFYSKNYITFTNVKDEITVGFYGLRDFKDEVYARKLLTCFKSYEKTSSNNAFEFNNLSLTIDPKNYDTVTSILDDDFISPLSKIAAIVSYNEVFFNLSKEFVISIARKQIKAEDTLDRGFGAFKNFLRPDFSFQFSKNISYRRNRSNLDKYVLNFTQGKDDKSYKLVLDIASFVLSERDPNQTLSDYRDTVHSDSFFVNKDIDGILREVFFLEEKVTNLKFMHNLNRSQILFLINFYCPVSRRIYAEDVLKFYRPGISETISEFLEKDEDHFRETIFSKHNDPLLKSLLTRDELNLVTNIFKDAFPDTLEFNLNDSKDVLHIVEIFLIFGEQALREVAQYFILSEITSRGRWVADGVEPAPVLKKFLNKSKYKLYSSEYTDYPISWLLELDQIEVVN